MTLHMLTYGNFDEGLTIVNDDGRIGRLQSDWPNMRVKVGANVELICEGSGWSSVVLCDECQNLIYLKEDSISSGYGSNDKGQHFCYDCCAEEDRRIMRREGKYWLYLVKKDDQYELHNWPGSLVIKDVRITNRKGLRQLRGKVHTMYEAFSFTFEGQRWYGRCQGDQQLAWVKRYKE